MSDTGLRDSVAAMRATGVAEPAIDVFTHYYRQLESGVTGIVGEDTIRPLTDPPALADIDLDAAAAAEALGRTAWIRLNGGLGTSMGLDRAKSLLEVRGGRTFLDLMVAQVRHARATHGVRLPLILMNSFRTREDCLAALAAYPDLGVDGLPLDFLQNQEPKLTADDLAPVAWPADPSLQWCPPGHGDLYTAILASGVLDALIERGFHYACASNGDNLGCTPDLRLAGWFAASGAPIAVEVCQRTAMDRKGGHLAVRVADGRLVLRESAQVAAADMVAFQDTSRHRYFNTNNLWFDLRALRTALTERGSVLGLPMIRNAKTVDPTDPDSPRVVQIETAMGAAVEVFDGAQAILVDRSRFLPVKTTNELVLLRSDACELGPDAVPRMSVDPIPTVVLDQAHYRTLAQLEARMPAGPPSLAEASSLTVHGDWTFGAGVRAVGAAVLPDTGRPERVADHATIATDGPQPARAPAR